MLRMAFADISKHAEYVERLVDDLVEAFRKKRWAKIPSLSTGRSLADNKGS